MSTLRIRKDTKQAVKQAAKLELLDSPKQAAVWVAGMNDLVGWNKYSLETEAA